MRGLQVVQGDPATAGRWESALDGCDAVVNLAGHNLFAERWNAEVKRKIRDSRVYSTENVVAAIAQGEGPPQGAGPGVGDRLLRPARRRGADRGRAPRAPTSWRSSAASGRRPPQPAEALGVRVARIRTGVVLAKGEGALGVMTPDLQVAPRRRGPRRQRRRHAQARHAASSG